MVLKKIVLLGFKSFFNRQEFEIGENLSFILGPNGCGKSNLIDAVRFCIGEDNLKFLRVEDITDLISVSKLGKSNFAEITLFFSNVNEEKSTLKEFGENFYIRRRLYKDGSSEYYFNNKILNFQDFNRLLNRFQFKKSPYMFITQGKVEDISLRRNVNLKSLIEQASGIDVLKIEEEEALKNFKQSNQNLSSLLALQENLRQKYDKIKNVYLLRKKHQDLSQKLEALEKTITLKKLFNVNFDINVLKSKLNLDGLSKFLSSSFKEKLEFYSFREKNVVNNIQSLEKGIELTRSKILGLDIKIKKLEQEKTLKLNLEDKFFKSKSNFEEKKKSINNDLHQLNSLLKENKNEFFSLSDEINRYTKSFFELVDLILSVLKSAKSEEFVLLKENILDSLKLFEESLSIKYIKEIRVNLIKYISKDENLLTLLKDKIEPIFDQNVNLKKFLLEKNALKANLAKEITNIEKLIEEKTLQLNDVLGELEYIELSKFKNLDEIKLIDGNLEFLFESKNSLDEELKDLYLKLENLNSEKSDIQLNLSNLIGASKSSNDDPFKEKDLSSLVFLNDFKKTNYYEYIKKQTEYEFLLSSNLNIKNEIENFNISNEMSNKFALEEDFATRELLRKEIDAINLGDYVFFNIDKEFDETKDRFEKVSLQVEDLKLSKSSLQKLQKKIKNEIYKKFRESFDEINKNFSYFFKKIFKGSAILFYDENIDDVEIRISFSNKFVKNNNMLSGGESTLVSMAFLFALYYYSPACFCMLDEIDAALDFENSKKLSLLLKELGKKIQLLVITHNAYVSEGGENLIGITLDNGESKVFNI
ncbi:chromosome segregation SMC family protein [Borreliella lusitaniae]|uniref:chromosome segregation SMC family protein n=1 Tax=Borreliella lusitaniae TaxID=100177 RepID=UPI002930DEEF|nr:chromosome segregation SMC family protein [Borreliella lusitaniae]WNY66437.1 chromosome segregation SMC family protein [Borreliella lusitaniae]